MLAKKNFTNTLDLKILLKSSFHPLTPVFVGSWRGQFMTKWRGITSELTYNTYLRNGWVVIDTGIKAETGTPIIEFSSWEPYVSSTAISLPNVMSYKFFFKKAFWRVGFLTRTSRVANEEWVSRLPSYLSLFNNLRKDGYLRRNTAVTLLALKPVSFLLTRFSLFTTTVFHLSSRVFAKILNLPSAGSLSLAFSTFERARAHDISVRALLPRLGHFADSYFLEGLKRKALYTIVKPTVSLSSRFSYSPSIHFYKLSDLLFKFNVIFSLYYTSRAAAVGRIFFERSIDALVTDLIHLVAVRVLSSESLSGLLSPKRDFLAVVKRILLKKCFFLLSFTRLSFATFLKFFLKFFSLATSHLVTRILSFAGLRSEGVERIVPTSFRHVVYDYKFKQIWAVAHSTSAAGSGVTASYRLKFEDLVRRFVPRFLFPKHKHADAKSKEQPKNTRFWRRPFKTKRWLKRELVGAKLYPLVRRFKRKPVSRFKLPFLKKQFSFLYFWSLNFFSFFSINNPCKRLFGVSARLKFFFKTFLKFLKFYSFTVAYFKIALTEGIKQHNNFLVKFNSLRLYFWWLLRRARSLLLAFFSLLGTISRRYYLSVEASEEWRLVQFRKNLSTFAGLVLPGALNKFLGVESSFDVSHKERVFALKAAFYTTYTNYLNVSYASDFVTSTKIRNYLRFTLLFRRALYAFFRQKLSAVLTDSLLTNKTDTVRNFIGREGHANALIDLLIRAKLFKTFFFPKVLIKNFFSIIRTNFISRIFVRWGRLSRRLRRFKFGILNSHLFSLSKTRLARRRFIRHQVRKFGAARKLLSRRQTALSFRRVFVEFVRKFPDFATRTSGRSAFLAFLELLRFTFGVLLRRFSRLPRSSRHSLTSDISPLSKVMSAVRLRGYYLNKTSFRLGAVAVTRSNLSAMAGGFLARVRFLKAFAFPSLLTTPFYAKALQSANDNCGFLLKEANNSFVTFANPTLLAAVSGKNTFVSTAGLFHKRRARHTLSLFPSLFLGNPLILPAGSHLGTSFRQLNHYRSKSRPSAYVDSILCTARPVVATYTSLQDFKQVFAVSAFFLYNTHNLFLSLVEQSRDSFRDVFYLFLLSTQSVTLDSAFLSFINSAVHAERASILLNYSTRVRTFLYTVANRSLSLSSTSFAWANFRLFRFLSSASNFPVFSNTDSNRRLFIANRKYLSLTSSGNVSSTTSLRSFESTPEEAQTSRPVFSSAFAIPKLKLFSSITALLQLLRRRALLKTRRRFKWRNKKFPIRRRIRVFSDLRPYKSLNSVAFRFLRRFRYLQASAAKFVNARKRSNLLSTHHGLLDYKFFYLPSVLTNFLTTLKFARLTKRRKTSTGTYSLGFTVVKKLNSASRVDYVRHFLVFFARRKPWALKTITSSNELLNQLQERMFRRVRAVRKIRLRSNARRLGIFPKRNKRQKKMYWKLVNSGKLEPVRSDYSFSGLSIFDRRNTRSMELAAEMRKKKFRFYTVKTQFKLRRRLWASLVLLVNRLRSTIRRFRTKLWRRRFYRIFRAGKWRLRKKSKARFIRALVKGVFFLNKLRALRTSVPYFNTLKKSLVLARTLSPSSFVSHNTLRVLRSLHMRFVRQFALRLTSGRLAVKRQFLKESKFIFIYKFIYTFVKKLHILLSHFTIFARCANSNSLVISSFSSFGVVGAISFTAYPYEYVNTLLFEKPLNRATILSGGISSLLLGSMFTVFSVYRGFLTGTSYPKLFDLFESFNNSTFVFENWRRATFVRRFARWNWTFAIRRIAAKIRFMRRTRPYNSFTSTRLKLPLSKGRSRNSRLKAVEVARLLKRVNLSNLLGVTTYACFLNKVRRIYKTGSTFSRNKSGGVRPSSVFPVVRARRRKRKALRRLRRAMRVNTLFIKASPPKVVRASNSSFVVKRDPGGVLKALYKPKTTRRSEVSLKVRRAKLRVGKSVRGPKPAGVPSTVPQATRPKTKKRSGRKEEYDPKTGKRLNRAERQRAARFAKPVAGRNQTST